MPVSVGSGRKARLWWRGLQPKKRSQAGSPSRPADELRGQAHRVAQPEPEHVAVEPQRLGVVVGGEDDVPQPLLAGDEPVPVRTHHPAVLEGSAVEHLQRVPGGVGKADQSGHPAIGEFLGRALLVGHPGGVQPVGHPAQPGPFSVSQPDATSRS
jgi:hypothetical protein